MGEHYILVKKQIVSKHVIDKLTGFDEVSPSFVRENILINGNTMTSKVNNKSYQFGELETPSLEELKQI